MSLLHCSCRFGRDRIGSNLTLSPSNSVCGVATVATFPVIFGVLSDSTALSACRRLQACFFSASLKLPSSLSVNTEQPGRHQSKSTSTSPFDHLYLLTNAGSRNQLIKEGVWVLYFSVSEFVQFFQQCPFRYVSSASCVAKQQTN